MSRLDSMIRRLQAQRAGLNWAAAEIVGLPGPVLEVGLGNGRTYSHLREILPEREIYVFDRQMNAHPASTPVAGYFLQGEADARLAEWTGAHGACAALVHYDLGVGVAEIDLPLAERFAPTVSAAMRPGGVLVSNNPFPGFDQLSEPPGTPAGRYFFQRKSG